MIRVAAAGDVHFDRNSRGRLSRHWSELAGKADLFLIAGDLTQVGHEEEAQVLADDLAECPVPVVSVLGNHDFHQDQQEAIKGRLRDAGVHVLEREAVTLKVNGTSVGVFGLKGFGGGFLGACCSDFGEPETKAFVRHTKMLAEELRHGLEGLKSDYRLALLHYSPTPDTLLGERKEIYPFLGSYLLGEAVDAAGAHAAFHGHAHKGIELGQTPGGVPVRNVAQPVIRHAFNIYCLHELATDIGCAPVAQAARA
ncbi:MAG: metallophosphoesterase [Bdellovibrionales bacterium]|nr:metallophosphoesterase [Bdellovibrionales bacterium]